MLYVCTDSTRGGWCNMAVVVSCSRVATSISRGEKLYSQSVDAMRPCSKHQLMNDSLMFLLSHCQGSRFQNLLTSTNELNNIYIKNSKIIHPCTLPPKLSYCRDINFNWISNCWSNFNYGPLFTITSDPPKILDN